MKKIPNILAFIISVLISVLWNESYSQNLISVQNGGAPTFYTLLSTAITNAQDGDTILIPGGSFGDVSITKRIHIVGVGHNPDSTAATPRTIIAQISIYGGAADYGSITGIHFISSNIYLYNTLTGYTFSRCYLGGILDQGSAYYFTIKECIILGYVNLKGENHSINNNIFFNDTRISSSSIKNNVFAYQSSVCLVAQNSTIENNIFYTETSYSNNVYYNNVNAGVNGVSGSSQGSGNFISPILPLSSIFMNYSTSNGIYTNNFHLLPGSPFINAGRDGTDIGIYGGTFPWKEGSVPFNPHFQTVNVSPTTNPSGNLPVNIKVSAQDH